MTFDPNETIEKKNIKDGPNELEAATSDFDLALVWLAQDPSLDNLKIVERAEKRLIEVQEAYHQAYLLLLRKIMHREP